MIEVVVSLPCYLYFSSLAHFGRQPFFHIIASKIASEIGEDKPVEIVTTTLVAFALSSVFTGITDSLVPVHKPISMSWIGLTFFLLGALRLGALVGFFPRHILVGCIGGVGAFLIETGYEYAHNILSTLLISILQIDRFDTHPRR